MVSCAPYKIGRVAETKGPSSRTDLNTDLSSFRRSLVSTKRPIKKTTFKGRSGNKGIALRSGADDVCIKSVNNSYPQSRGVSGLLHRQQNRKANVF